jgi:hypothetical protein
MGGFQRFEVFTRSFGLQVQDAPPLLGTNDPAEAFRTCRSAMRFEQGTLQSTGIRDCLLGKEYTGIDVFGFANQYGIVVRE